jgi:hypothetical protein
VARQMHALGLDHKDDFDDLLLMPTFEAGR